MKPIVFAPLLIAACSSSPNPVALESYCDEYSRVTCGAAQKCGCLDSLTSAFCPTQMKDECKDEVVTVAQQGKRSYDAAAAGRCLSELDAVLGECSSALLEERMPGSCDQILVGKVKAGGACGSSEDCAAPLECLTSVCTEMPGENQKCLASSRCAADLYCGADDLCHRPNAQGGACPTGSEACADNLYCDTRTMTCQPPIASGESCAHATSECDDDLYCSSAKTCAPYPGLGQSCTASSSVCADGLYCDSKKVCQAQLASGATCTGSDQCLSEECSKGVCTTDTNSCPFL
jgi:hypothetical protein